MRMNTCKATNVRNDLGYMRNGMYNDCEIMNMRTGMCMHLCSDCFELKL